MDEKNESSAKKEVNQVYTVPMEITSELKFKGTIPISLIIAAFLMFFLAQRLEGMVYQPFKIAWYIYNVVVALLLCIKTKINGEKKLIQSILIFFTRDTNCYMSIDNPEEYEEMEVPEKDVS